MRDYRDENGNPLDGASEILSEAVLGYGFEAGAAFGAAIGEPWRLVRDEAAHVGTLVHAAIAASLRGEVFEIQPPPRERKRVVRALASFGYYIASLNADHGDDWGPLRVEEPIVNQSMGFGGTPDAVLRVGKRRILVDWKTGTEIRLADRVRSCAYAHYLCWAVENMQIHEVHTVRLDKREGGPPEVDVILYGSEEDHCLVALFHAAWVVRRRMQRLEEVQRGGGPAYGTFPAL